MEYIYATLLLHRAGKEISEENLRKVIEATGIKAEESKIKTVMASLKGVDIEKELEAAALMAAQAAAPVATTKEEKKEEKQEAAAEGLGALFG